MARGAPGGSTADVDGDPRILLLGPFAVETASGQTTLGGGRVAALVALLALRAGRSMRREDVIDVLWDGDPPADPNGALRQIVRRCRRVLGDKLLTTTGAGGVTTYALHGAVVDLHEFESLRRVAAASRSGDDAQAALALVRGVPFEGITPDAAFDDVRRAAELQIDELRRAVVIAGLAADRPDAINDATEWADAHPDDEAVWSGLVTCLARSGRAAAAMRTVGQARRALRSGGLDERGDLAAAEHEVLAMIDRARFRRPAVPAIRALVGRDDELRRIDELITAVAHTDEPAAVAWPFVTVCGPPGIGTSALIAAAAARLDRQGRIVIHARGHAVGDPHLVEHVASSIGWTSGATDADRWVQVAVPSTTVLVVDHDRAATDAPDSSAWERLIGCWPGPVLIGAPTPVGVPSERVVRLSRLAEHDAVELVTDVVTRTRGDGGALSAEERADIAAAAALADGFPLALAVLGRYLATSPARELRSAAVPVPAGLDDVVRSILATLSPGDAALASLLATIGGPFDLIDAQRASTRPRPPRSQVSEQVHRLVDAGLVVTVPAEAAAPYRMLRPIRECVHRVRGAEPAPALSGRRAIVLASRARGWADAIGTAAESDALDHMRPRLDEMTALLRAPTTSATVAASLRSAAVFMWCIEGRWDQARRLLAGRNDADDASPRSARDWLDTALVAYFVEDYATVVRLGDPAETGWLPTCDRVSLAATRVRALRHLGRLDDAGAALDELAPMVAGDEFDELIVTYERALLLTYLGDIDAALAGLTEARQEFERLGIPRAMGGCEIHLAWCHLTRGRYAVAGELVAEATDRSLRHGHLADEMFSLHTAARLAERRGDHVAALRDAKRVERYARDSNDRVLLARAIEVTVDTYRRLGDHERADDAWLEAHVARRRVGCPQSPIEQNWVIPAPS